MQKFELKRLISYSNDDIINEIKRVASLIKDEVITQAAFRKHSRVSVATLREHFGSWQKAFESADLANRCHDPTVTAKKRKHRAKSMSNEDVLNELRIVGQKLNQGILSRKQFDTHSLISSDVVRKRFGSWQAGLKRAGLSVPSSGKRYTDEECFENLLQVWTHYGRPPKRDEMYKPPSTVGARAYVLRWGSWGKALHAFTEQVNQDLEKSDLPSPTPILENHSKPIKATSEADKKEIRIGLRYAVLKRDRFRCVLCGRSPATDPKCSLHVDHIVPFSKGGKTVIENLRTLCMECNIGKRDSVET